VTGPSTTGADLRLRVPFLARVAVLGDTLVEDGRDIAVEDDDRDGVSA
jgi:hypothetical protein